MTGWGWINDGETLAAIPGEVNERECNFVDPAEVDTLGAVTIFQDQTPLSRDPDNGAALAYGALSFAAIGNVSRAREWIDRALMLDPDNMYMRYNLAWAVLAFFGNKEEALEL